MSFSTNVQSFLSSQRTDLVEAYLLLVGIELALKDGNFVGTVGGHDVPGMLIHASESPAAIAKQGVQVKLRGLAHALTNSLRAVSCQGVNNQPQPVPPTCYPFLRYCRCEGDWQGQSETPVLRLAELLDTCRNTRSVLTSVSKTIGIKL